MRDHDVAARQVIAEAMRADGTANVDPALVEAGLAIETRNAERLAAIVDDGGWPSVVHVGMEGVEAAWYIASHAGCDLELQRRCLDLMTEAVAAGEPSPDRLAWLTDRVLVAEGKAQRYGTQFATTDEGLRLLEVDDPEGLDARRAAVGLPPLGEQLDRLRSDLQG
ncbi:MAG: hypothetical protein QOG03_2523 [Actinomycetota bacterium]|nr:hypothetical protein [Actinomycetota bacterium]